MEDIAIKTQKSLGVANSVFKAVSTSIEISIEDVSTSIEKATEGLKKFEKLKKILSGLANCLQYLDGAMAIFSLIQVFLPASDSPELAYMKSQFGIVNTKLDSVLTGMAIRIVEFSSGRYKIRKIFALESTYPKEIIEF